MARTLYICYFGVREPLVQTQVLPYLREIARKEKGERRKEKEIEVSLLTFEPGREEKDLAEFDEVRKKLAAEGIEWDWLPYHKRFSAVATLWDILRGAFYVWRRIGRVDVLHGRVHVPTLMAALARKFSLRRPKLLFDIRGFFPEEYTDAGVWPENGLLFRSAKRVERWLMKEADGFVVLTEKARSILFPEIADSIEQGGHDKFGRPVEVIPCCVDLARFASANAESREEIRRELCIGDRFVAVYVGAFGGWYLTEETADFFGALKAKTSDTFALILTQSKREMIEPLLRKRGFADGDYFIARVPSADIPRYLSAADVAVSFIKKCYSKQASSPTKNAEYLACGLPIIANEGVGDVDTLILENGVGALLKEFTPAGHAIALDEIQRLGDIAKHCRKVARQGFDLETVGGESYRRIYKRLLS